MLSEKRASELDKVGASATLMWVSILLRTAEEIIREAAPERIARAYGEMSEQDRGHLDERLASASSALDIAIELVDRARR